MLIFRVDGASGVCSAYISPVLFSRYTDGVCNSSISLGRVPFYAAGVNNGSIPWVLFSCHTGGVCNGSNSLGLVHLLRCWCVQWVMYSWVVFPYDTADLYNGSIPWVLFPCYTSSVCNGNISPFLHYTSSAYDVSISLGSVLLLLQWWFVKWQYLHGSFFIVTLAVCAMVVFA